MVEEIYNWENHSVISCLQARLTHRWLRPLEVVRPGSYDPFIDFHWWTTTLDLDMQNNVNIKCVRFDRNL